MQQDIILEPPEECPICNLKLSEYMIGKRAGKYKGQIFKIHLKKEHNIELDQFYKERGILGKCACGCGQDRNSIQINKVITIKAYCKNGNGGGTHRPIWNKGLTRQTNESVNKQALQMEGNKNPHFNVSAWNKGLTKDSNKSLKKMGEARKGCKLSEETKEKISKALIGNKNNFGSKYSLEARENIRSCTLKQIKRQKFNCSLPEFEFEKFLKREGVKYVHQYIYGEFVYDFLIFIGNKKIIVAVNGDYFHANPKFIDEKSLNKIQISNLKRDYNRYKTIADSDEIYGIIVMWESEIWNTKLMKKRYRCRLKKLLKSNVSVVGKLMTWRCLKNARIM